MNKFIYSILIAGILFFSTGCRKYVEIPPENVRILKLTSDYQALLYYSTTIDQAYFLPLYSGDDIGNEILTWQNTLSVAAANAYSWADRNYSVIEEDAEWANLYKQMFTYNTVIQGVMKSEGGSQTEKQLALSSALVHRAFTYFTLINIYARQYDAATASIDPGLPLITEPNFTGDLTRVSVQKIYDQIIADLNEALPGLPDQPDFISNPSKAAVYAILARVALNKREFAEAERYADLTLAIQNTVLDLNTYKAVPTTYPTKFLNKEEIFFKRTLQAPLSLAISVDAANMYDKTNDLRYTKIYLSDPTYPAANFPVGNGNKGYFKYKLSGDGIYVGPSVPEILLIKAECKARTGNAGAAVDILNEFRKKRYDNSATYVNLTATTADAALHLVIDERKREFVGKGFRWFDQRRLSKDAGFVPTVTRIFKGATYTLEPGSNRYTYAIPDKNILLNPEIIQNPR